jgi:hypothetical protein
VRQNRAPVAQWSTTINLTNAILEDHPPARFEGDAYIVEFTVALGDPPPDPHVDMEPHAPFDITLRDERPVIEELRLAATVVLIALLLPASDMFPEGYGMRLPWGPMFS